MRQQPHRPTAAVLKSQKIIGVIWSIAVASVRNGACSVQGVVVAGTALFLPLNLEVLTTSIRRALFDAGLEYAPFSIPSFHEVVPTLTSENY
jgi:hypothetical protein